MASAFTSRAISEIVLELARNRSIDCREITNSAGRRASSVVSASAKPSAR